MRIAAKLFYLPTFDRRGKCSTLTSSSGIGMMPLGECSGGTVLSLRAISISPRNGQAPQGLLIALHGWGANAQDVASLANYLDLPEFQMIFPDAPFPFPFGPDGRVWYNFPPNYTFTCEPSLAQQPELVESRHLLTE